MVTRFLRAIAWLMVTRVLVAIASVDGYPLERQDGQPRVPYASCRYISLIALLRQEVHFGQLLVLARPILGVPAPASV
jgi:hypothetical protein